MYDTYDDYDGLSNDGSWDNAVRMLEDGPAKLEDRAQRGDEARHLYARPDGEPGLVTWEKWAELRKAQVELAWDLGTSLPEGHPFAPSVDGKQAA